MSHVRFLWVVHVRDNLSQAIISVGRTLLLPRKRAPDITPSPTEWSAGLPPSFSPNTAIETVIKTKHLLTNKLHRFTRPITPACDRYVQYLHTGANPSVLNWYRWGLQPCRCWLATPLPDLYNWWSYTFHLMAPPDLRLSIQTIPTETKREQTLNLMSVGLLYSTSTAVYHLSIVWANDDPPRDRVTRVIRKVGLNLTITSYNSYKLNAQSK
jgi:hypothetical protein